MIAYNIILFNRWCFCECFMLLTFFQFFQSLVSLVNGFQEKLSGLEEQAAQLELVGSDASKATISRSMTTVWQRWTRLRSVARGQERVLEDTAQEWKTFREKVHWPVGRNNILLSMEK